MLLKYYLYRAFKTWRFSRKLKKNRKKEQPTLLSESKLVHFTLKNFFFMMSEKRLMTLFTVIFPGHTQILSPWNIKNIFSYVILSIKHLLD